MELLFVTYQRRVFFGISSFIVFDPQVIELFQFACRQTESFLMSQVNQWDMDFVKSLARSFLKLKWIHIVIIKFIFFLCLLISLIRIIYYFLLIHNRQCDSELVNQIRTATAKRPDSVLSEYSFLAKAMLWYC